MRVVALALALAVAGCADAGKTVEGGGALSLEPAESATVQGEYQRLAECAYRRLESPGLRKADFPASKSVRLTLDSGAVKYWELVFTAKGPRTTAVDLAVVRTVWGADTGSARDAMPAVRACAAS